MIYRRAKATAIMLIFFVVANHTSFSQTFKIEVFVSEQPEEEVVLGTVKGDKFSPIDTVMPVAGGIAFELSDSAVVGVYRILLGQTVYAQVMHEAPQKLDFIFNREDCVLKTNFKSPADSLQVITSKENKVWVKFMQLEKVYSSQLTDLVSQINYFQQKTGDKYYTEKRKAGIVKKYNEIQKKRNSLITSTAEKNPGLFAAKMIKMYAEPFLDGNLSEAKRTLIFERNYFKNLDFSDETLINSPVYTQKVYQYLISYAKRDISHEEQISEMNRAADKIIENTKTNAVVGDFIVDFMMRGFEMLELNEVLQHISETYTPSVPCSDDDKSTLKRRLDSQKMTAGTAAPTFTLVDAAGDSISLTNIASKYKLIIFWASWCPHCEQLLPDIYQWYLNRDMDVEVIAVSIDENQDEWRAFVQERGYDWVNCIEPYKWSGKVATAYNIYATPTMFLLDNENNIISKPLTFDEFLVAVMELAEQP